MEPAQHDAGAEPRVFVEQPDPREAFEQHLEHDPAFEARQGGAEAVVDAPPERQVGARGAADIEPVRVLERVGSRLAAPTRTAMVSRCRTATPFTFHSDPPMRTRHPCQGDGQHRRVPHAPVPRRGVRRGVLHLRVLLPGAGLLRG